MAMAAVADSQFSIGRVVSRTFAVIGQNAVPFLVLSFLAVLPVELLNYFFGILTTARGGVTFATQSGSFWLTLAAVYVAAVLFSMVLQASLVHGTIKDLNGERASVGEMLSTGLRLFFPLVGFAIVSTLGVGLGFVLLIVPGLILMTVWSVGIPVLVTERTGVFDALGRSGDLTRGHRWSIFGLLIVFYIGVFAVSMMARPLFGVAALGSSLSGVSVAYLVFDLVYRMAVAVIAATGFACLYYELRASKEGVGPQQLASVFD